MLATGLISALIALLLTVAAISFGWITLRQRAWRRHVRWACFAFAFSLGLLAIAPLIIAVWIGVELLVGQPASDHGKLWPGVDYRRVVEQSPRRVVLHQLTIDLDRVARVAVSPPLNGDTRSPAQTVGEGLKQLNGELAINGSYFTPCVESDPFRYYPYAGDPVQALGPTVGSDRSYGWPTPGAPGADIWIPFWHTASGQFGFGMPLPEDTDAAVSGRGWLVRDGQYVSPVADPPDPNDFKPYPRTLIGLDQAHKHLYIVVVDGKQPRYSLGITLREAADRLIALGAHEALALDGGGSSTLVCRNARTDRVTCLSRPCHTKIPGCSRPVANVLAFTFVSGSKK